MNKKFGNFFPREEKNFRIFYSNFVVFGKSHSAKKCKRGPLGVFEFLRKYLTLSSPFAIFEPYTYGADLGRSRLV